MRVGGSEGEGWGAMVLEGSAPALILAKTNLGLARETQRDKETGAETVRDNDYIIPTLVPPPFQ